MRWRGGGLRGRWAACCSKRPEREFLRHRLGYRWKRASPPVAPDRSLAGREARANLRRNRRISNSFRYGKDKTTDGEDSSAKGKRTIHETVFLVTIASHAARERPFSLEAIDPVQTQSASANTDSFHVLGASLLPDLTCSSFLCSKSHCFYNRRIERCHFKASMIFSTVITQSIFLP